MTEIEVSITGRVQMVMFRDFAQRKARFLKIRGTVKNLADGSVRVIAQGEKETLERYIELLHKGSMLSHIENISVSWREPQEEFIGFKIIY